VSRIFALCLFTIAVASSAAAQTHGRSRADQTFRFDLPAGPLGDALSSFHLITAKRVVAPAGATVDGLATPGVTGTFTSDEALARLLAGTGLTFHETADGTYAIEVTVAPQNVEVTGHVPYRAETTTTATRTLTPLRDVPQAITVVTDRLIADQRMQSMADVVRYIPGVGMSQGEGNRDAPVFRGNSTTADFFVDGVRDDVQYFRDLYNIAQVEALKGPNAMIFGRGGAGGVINRTTRQADWMTSREVTLLTGSNDNRRATLDLNQPVTDEFAARLTSMYENSASYRRGVELERYAFNPTLALSFNGNAVVHAGYEHFHDNRTADRGVPSQAGAPVASDVSTFFGDPNNSRAHATVDALSTAVDYKLGGGGAMLRSRTRLARYDKFYQNVYPSAAVNDSTATASIAAYNSSTERRNLFNQTDLNFTRRTAGIDHTVLIGAELGRQITGNFRNTGYFTAVGPNTTSINVPVDAPTIAVPVTFRQSATDANNHAVATVAAVYAQDQLSLSRHVQAIFGVRYDRFNVDVHNNRSGADFASRDNLVSPRIGVVVKPMQPLSVYGSYSVAYLPRAGEQLSSLSISNQALDPEEFRNIEAGAKWQLRPDLSLTTAIYRLDRTNIVIADPNDSARSIFVDGQRTKGLEVELAGNVTRAWSVMGGYTHQRGRITRTLSASAQAGAVLAYLPGHTFSVWNRYDAGSRVGLGVGVVHSSDMFTSTDNRVTLPRFTRVDSALFVRVSDRLRAQVNIENLFDVRYYPFANGNNNITPGAPRAARVSLTARF